MDTTSTGRDHHHRLHYQQLHKAHTGTKDSLLPSTYSCRLLAISDTGCVFWLNAAKQRLDSNFRVISRTAVVCGCISVELLGMYCTPSCDELEAIWNSHRK